MNFSVDIVSIPVADQDRAKAFYAEVLGFAVREDSELGDGRRWVELVPPAGGASVSLVCGEEVMPAGSLQGVVLGTDDAHAAYAELTARGVAFAEPVSDQSWGSCAPFQDPDGNRWMLVGPAV
jgi:predicted enzyme related to lactoylglutathione lyase